MTVTPVDIFHVKDQGVAAVAFEHLVSTGVKIVYTAFDVSMKAVWLSRATYSWIIESTGKVSLTSNSLFLRGIKI